MVDREKRFWRRHGCCRVSTLSFSHQTSLPAARHCPDKEKLDAGSS